MSDKQVCILDKLHQIMESLENEFETDNTIVLLAVELNPEGFPVSRVKKIQGNAANTMAGYVMIERTLKEEIEKWHQKIEAVGNISDKINHLIEKMTGTLPTTGEELEELMDKMKADDPETYSRLKDVIKNIKGSFGK